MSSLCKLPSEVKWLKEHFVQASSEQQALATDRTCEEGHFAFWAGEFLLSFFLSGMMLLLKSWQSLQIGKFGAKAPHPNVNHWFHLLSQSMLVFLTEYVQLCTWDVYLSPRQAKAIIPAHNGQSNYASLHANIKSDRAQLFLQHGLHNCKWIKWIPQLNARNKMQFYKLSWT